MVTFVHASDTGLSMTVLMSTFLWKLICIATKVSLFKEERATFRRYLDMVNDVWQTRIHRMKSAIYTRPIPVRPLAAPLNLLKGCDARPRGVSQSHTSSLCPRCSFCLDALPPQPPHQLEQSHSFFKTQVSVTVSCGPTAQGFPVHRRATTVLPRATRCRQRTGGLPELRDPRRPAGSLTVPGTEFP